MSEKFKKALRIAVNVGCGFEGDAEDAAELLTLIVGLESRIAELEELVEELKPYRDGYDGEFLEPTDDRFYLIRHTNGQLVTWRKVDNHDDINFLGWGAKGKPRRYWRLPEVQE